MMMPLLRATASDEKSATGVSDIWPFTIRARTSSIQDSASSVVAATQAATRIRDANERDTPYEEGPAQVLPPSISPRDLSEVEMATMSAVGLGFSFGVIYFLALNGDDATELSRLLVDTGQLENALEGVADNLYTAAVPRTTADVFSVALGEGIAGVIGAGATAAVSLLFRLSETASVLNEQVGGASSETKRSIGRQAENRRTVFSEAVADGDYFFTRAAALPLFEAIGLPPLLASVTSAILASVPYELVKLGSQRKASMIEEAALLEELLREEQDRSRAKAGFFSSLMNRKQSAATAVSGATRNVDPKALVPINKGPGFDFPEIFSDITKWLEYDVLKADFSGKMVVGGQLLSQNIEGAVFGFLAALSSQLYADLIYRYTEYGTEQKREESRNRTLRGWARLYTRKCLNAAALFGIYETVRGPVISFLVTLLSGGVDSCVGSAEYDLCVESYAISNPPGASYEAEFRSLLTALVSLSSRLQNDDSIDKVEFVRSVIVKLYSFGLQIFTFDLYAT